jgi:hypothetical protein
LDGRLPESAPLIAAPFPPRRLRLRTQIAEISSFIATDPAPTVAAMSQRAATTVSRAAFLVERYWPGVDEEVLSSALPRLELSARAMTAEGHEVHHVGSFLMPADQVVISVISADSEAVVREVNQRAAMPVDRIAKVTPYGFGW